MYITLTEKRENELAEDEIKRAMIPCHSFQSLKIKSILSQIFQLSINEIEECLSYKINTHKAKDIRFRAAVFSLFDHQNTLDDYLKKWGFNLKKLQ